VFVYEPCPGSSAWLGLRQSAAYFSQASLQLGSADCSGHHQGNGTSGACVCAGVIRALAQSSKSLGCPISGSYFDHAFRSPVPVLCQLLAHGNAPGPRLPCADIHGPCHGWAQGADHRWPLGPACYCGDMGCDSSPALHTAAAQVFSFPS